MIILYFGKTNDKTLFCPFFFWHYDSCHLLFFSPFPFATLIHLNRWQNWAKGLLWIGVVTEREREKEGRNREGEIDPSGISFRRVFTYATRFSTYFHSRCYQIRNRSQERSVEKRSTIFHREQEFHSILEFPHECIFFFSFFIVFASRTKYFGYRNTISRSVFLSLNFVNNKNLHFYPI